MKAFRTYATLTAVVLIFAATGLIQASDGGKGSGPNSGNTNTNSNSGPGNSNTGNSNSGPGNSNNGNANVQVRLRTNLAGAAIAGKKPEGNGDFRNENGRMRLNVEVENVNLADGTVLTVAITHAGITTVAGMITLNSAGLENELELDSQHGDVVPMVASGDMITVSNGASVILAGAF